MRFRPVEMTDGRGWRRHSTSGDFRSETAESPETRFPKCSYTMLNILLLRFTLARGRTLVTSKPQSYLRASLRNVNAERYFVRRDDVPRGVVCIRTAVCSEIKTSNVS